MSDTSNQTAYISVRNDKWTINFGRFSRSGNADGKDVYALADEMRDIIPDGFTLKVKHKSVTYKRRGKLSYKEIRNLTRS
jgi:hypothetical protein